MIFSEHWLSPAHHHSDRDLAAKKYLNRDRRTASGQNENCCYISVRLDSPFLAAPVNCALMTQDDGGHILVWNRDDLGRTDLRGRCPRPGSGPLPFWGY
jgi:hypothetical protein